MSSQTTVVSTVPRSVKRFAKIARDNKKKTYVKSAGAKRATAFASSRVSSARQSLYLPLGGGQTVLPERYATKLVTSQQVYIAASGMDQTNGNYFNVKVNSIVSPFSTTYTLNAVTPVYSFNGQYTTGSSTILNPIGYSTLAGLYDRYKVVGYKLRVSVMTGLSTDIYEGIIFPLGQEEIPNSTASLVNSYVLKGQPQAKYKLIHNGGNQMVLTQKGSVNQLLGMRRQQWMDIPYTDTVGGSSQPAYPGYVGFYLMPLTGATNTQPVAVDITLTQYVEFTDIKNSALVN